MTPALDQTDLHGLVDGHIDGERRAAALRRLAMSPADRACVEAWQGQNDLLRSSFAGIEREPLPVMLDLKAKSRLQCIPANDAPLVEPPADPAEAAGSRGRIVAAVATIAVIAAGLAGSWFLQETSRSEQAPMGESRESAIEAVAPSLNANGIQRLPTADIPDLHTAGFGFTGAETTANPPTIVFHYEAGSERLRISVSRTPVSGNSSTSVTAIGKGYGWQDRQKSFVISGTVEPHRLRDIAAALQKESSPR